MALCYRSGLGQVWVLEEAREKEQKQIETRQKSFGVGGKQKGLGFNLCVAPSCIQSYFRSLIRQKRKQGGTEVDIQTGDTDGNN